MAPIDVKLTFDCTNTNPADSLAGLNTLLLTASTAPTPDIVALAATIASGLIVDIVPAPGVAGVFAVASVNAGASGTITVTADTGGVALPITIGICELNPSTAACQAAPASSVTTTIAANATPAFGIVLNGSGTIPFDPGRNRVFVRFKTATGVTVGSTSVAARTQ